MIAARLSMVIALAVLFTAIAVWILGSHATAARIAALETERSLVMTRHGMLEYAVWGEGPPLLVVHGAGGGYDQGRLLAGAVGGDHFTFISVSRVVREQRDCGGGCCCFAGDLSNGFCRNCGALIAKACDLG